MPWHSGMLFIPVPLVPCLLPVGVTFAGVVRAFTPVLYCCTSEQLCERWGMHFAIQP